MDRTLSSSAHFPFLRGTLPKCLQQGWGFNSEQHRIGFRAISVGWHLGIAQHPRAASPKRCAGDGAFSERSGERREAGVGPSDGAQRHGPEAPSSNAHLPNWMSISDDSLPCFKAMCPLRHLGRVGIGLSATPLLSPPHVPFEPPLNPSRGSIRSGSDFPIATLPSFRTIGRLAAASAAPTCAPRNRLSCLLADKLAGASAVCRLLLEWASYPMRSA